MKSLVKDVRSASQKIKYAYIFIFAENFWGA